MCLITDECRSDTNVDIPQGSIAKKSMLRLKPSYSMAELLSTSLRYKRIEFYTVEAIGEVLGVRADFHSVAFSDWTGNT